LGDSVGGLPPSLPVANSHHYIARKKVKVKGENTILLDGDFLRRQRPEAYSVATLTFERSAIVNSGKGDDWSSVLFVQNAGRHSSVKKNVTRIIEEGATNTGSAL
jgi:hypothetical protein